MKKNILIVNIGIQQNFEQIWLHNEPPALDIVFF
jgi:hypothetical protein